MLRKLLSEDGSLWITIDDNEAHYLKVLCDEIFGRANFVASLVWQKKYAASNDALWLSSDHDQILVYAKVKISWKPNRLKRTEKSNSAYKNPDNDPRGPWQSDNYTCNKSSKERPNLYYSIKNPFTSEDVFPKTTAVWRYSPERHDENMRENLVYWGATGSNSVPRFKRLLSAVQDSGGVPQSVWLWEDVGHNQDAKREQLVFNPSSPFTTPKPERLLGRIISLATDPGDLVLDSFAGSGTTGAVAHKMGRRWIMIELGDHIHSHIIPRLTKVIDGQDPGGVTETTGWKGGGGFRYFKLAPSLLELDRFGNHVISAEYNPAMLAEAMCKLMGFTFQPDQELYWQQGRSTETDFLYTTTQTLSRQQIESLSEEVGPNRTLMVCCSAFRARAGDFPNLTLRKIPLAVLARCEWGKDDYSLNVRNLPQAPLPPEHPDHELLPESALADRPPASPAEAKRRRALSRTAAKQAEPSLFEETEGAQ